MIRSQALEITEVCELPASEMARIHRELTRTNAWLGNTSAIVDALRRDPFPVRKVLDVGCGHGGMLGEIRRRLGVEGIGVDRNPPCAAAGAFPIVRADATRDPLPEADAAICVFVAHHLNEEEVVAMIRNVGRSCRRLIVLDTVRSRVPLFLFRCFVAPFLYSVNAADGCLSIQRSYTHAEFRSLVERATTGTGAVFTHHTNWFRTRQIADIVWR
jgi:SAM-dependent methyltransferase